MTAKLDDEGPIQRSEATLEEALDLVGGGRYTNFLAVVGGLLTLAAMCMSQGMYLVLPAVGCQFDLSPAERGFIGSAPFLGSMLSATCWGFLVDVFGRRRVLLATSFGSTLSVLLASLAPTSWALNVASFVIGFMIAGVFGNPYVYVSEFVPARLRANKLTIVAAVSSLANIFSPCVAWGVFWLSSITNLEHYFSSWRLYLILNSTPMLASFLLLLFIPESPKFLLSQGDQPGAIKALSRVFAVNNSRKREDFPITRLRLDADDTAAAKREDTNFWQFLLILFRQVKELFTPPLLIYTLICSAMKFAVIGLYSVIYLWLPTESNRLIKYYEFSDHYDVTICEVMAAEGGSVDSNRNSSRSVTLAAAANALSGCTVDSEIYLVIIFVGLIYSASCIAMTFLVRKVELDILLGINICFSGVVCLAMLFFREIALTLFSLGFLVAILAASQPAVYGIIVRFFPTPLRATATAVCVVFGRLAVPIVSSLIGASFHEYCNEAYYSLAFVLAGIGMICFLTPKKKTA